jgi:hypothetical protein
LIVIILLKVNLIISLIISFIFSFFMSCIIILVKERSLDELLLEEYIIILSHGIDKSWQMFIRIGWVKLLLPHRVMVVIWGKLLGCYHEWVKIIIVIHLRWLVHILVVFLIKRIMCWILAIILLNLLLALSSTHVWLILLRPVIKIRLRRLNFSNEERVFILFELHFEIIIDLSVLLLLRRQKSLHLEIVWYLFKERYIYGSLK